MKTLKSIALATFTFISTVTANAQNNPYIGTWEKTAVTTQQGQKDDSLIPSRIDISDTDGLLTIAKTFAVSDDTSADAAITEQVPLDGKPSTSLTADNSTRVSSISYKSGTRTLTQNKTISESNAPEDLYVRITQHWTLSADGKTLTIKENYDALKNESEKWTGTIVYKKAD